MFNVGGGELLVILLIALMVLGPDRLPGFAKKAGKMLGEVRRISNGFQSEIRQAMDFHDEKPHTQSPTQTATPSTPRLVEPPAPARSDDHERALGSGDTPPVAPATPEEGGDSASGTSAA